MQPVLEIHLTNPNAGDSLFRIAEQGDDSELQARFSPVAQAMAENEEKIVYELNFVQGPAMDVGGYYKLDAAKASAAMRPSATLNAIVAAV